jgi:hypothetical protein
VAGTVDALFSSNKTNREHIADWKTGKFRTFSPYGERLLKPFNDLHNCQAVMYSLQTSLYRLILERQGHAMGTSWIIHLDGEARAHKCLDLRERLLAWIDDLNSREVGIIP